MTDDKRLANRRTFPSAPILASLRSQWLSQSIPKHRLRQWHPRAPHCPGFLMTSPSNPRDGRELCKGFRECHRLLRWPDSADRGLANTDLLAWAQYLASRLARHPPRAPYFRRMPMARSCLLYMPPLRPHLDLSLVKTIILLLNLRLGSWKEMPLEMKV